MSTLPSVLSSVAACFRIAMLTDALHRRTHSPPPPPPPTRSPPPPVTVTSSRPPPPLLRPAAGNNVDGDTDGQLPAWKVALLAIIVIVAVASIIGVCTLVSCWFCNMNKYGNVEEAEEAKPAIGAKSPAGAVWFTSLLCMMFEANTISSQILHS